MINQLILQYCRYFKYESVCPYSHESDEATFWFFEREYYWGPFLEQREYWEKEDFEINDAIECFPELKPTIQTLPTYAKGMVEYAFASINHMSPMGKFVLFPRFKNYKPNITEQELFQELKKKDLLKRCRYYNGENAPKCEEDSLWWDYERVWVETNLNKKWDDIKGFMKFLVEHGFARFRPLDGTPAALKGILVSRLEHWSYCTDDFPEWYLINYIKEHPQPNNVLFKDQKNFCSVPKNLWKEYDWLRRQDLIAQCRYYRDGKNRPKDVHEFFWDAEKKWVDMNYNHQYAELDENLWLYISCGMGDYRCDDKTPSTLKALMWKKQYPKTNTKMSSLSFKIIYERDYLKLPESPTLTDFRSHSEDIPSFARKYRTFFENGCSEDGYFFLAESVFCQEAMELGFKLDFGESMEKMFPEATKSEDVLSNALDEIRDVQALGNAILSQWRMHARGGYSSEGLWQVRKWFWRAFDRLFSLSVKSDDDLYRLTGEYLSVKATDLPSFARKYIHFFTYGSGNDSYRFDDTHTFPEECDSFGFDMDCLRSYGERYESDPLYAKMTTVEYVNTLSDIHFIGTALYSQWRFYNHWSGQGSELWDSREWFLLMFQRLLELAEKKQKVKRGVKKELALEEAKRMGYDGVEYWKRWNGVSVYSAIYDTESEKREEPLPVGQPLWIFVSDDLRTFSYQGFLTDTELKEIIENLKH